jgi:prophage antirepressor-like protein
METEITDPNCIVKAFQNNNISIIKDNDNKYYFRGSDIAKALEITNIRSSIQNFTDKEKGVRKVDTLGGPQDIIFLSSHGVYRLLYSSKKKIAEQFREWVGDILDDIIFNQSKELKKQLEESKKTLEEKDKLLELERRERNKLLNRKFYNAKPGHLIYLFRDSEGPNASYKIGKTENIIQREDFYSKLTKSGSIIYIQYCLNCHVVERVLHHMLDKYRINPKQEWFKFPNEDIPIQTISSIVDIMDSHIETLDSFIPNLHTFLKPTSIQPNIHQPYIQQPYIKTNTETPIMETIPMETTSGLPIERHITETSITETSITETSITETPIDTPTATTTTHITETPIRYKIDDFEQFIKDFCELGDDKYCYKPDIKQAHRIWCKSIVDKDVTKKLDTYLSSKFKLSQVWENDIRRNVYKGVSLKPLEYHSKNNHDYELFLKQKCKFYYSYRTSYADFFDQFVKWKHIQLKKYYLN